MTRSFAFAALVAASSIVPTALQAQADKLPTTPVDSIAFPRQFVRWVFTGQGDSAFAHAAESLRGGMKSATDVSAMPERIKARFGDLLATDAETQFDEGELKVYITALRFSQAPEPGAWVVAYNPKTNVVERAQFTSLSSVKQRYPNAKLP